MTLSFETEKYIILRKLNKYSHKLKFPQMYIQSFSRDSSQDETSFIYQIISDDYDYEPKIVIVLKNYNKLIDQCHRLKIKLNKLTNWGNLFNSKSYWNYTISNIEINFELHSKRTLKLMKCTSCRYFIYRPIKIFDDFTLKYQSKFSENIQVYLKIYKFSDEYIFMDDDLHVSFDKKYVDSLLC
jgi:hypothetical protein